MINKLAFFSLLLLGIAGCNTTPGESLITVYTADIDRFWQAYDRILEIDDEEQQRDLLEQLYFEPGTPGLKALRKARQYAATDYLQAIRQYPQFWNSIRANTLTAPNLAKELVAGAVRLQAIYPETKPAKVYFTIGALRTNGTTQDSLVLIGAELAMTDSSTVTEEFQGRMKEGLRTFFDSNPIEDLVLLNVHELVHTQQQPMQPNLLAQCLYEGVAEFVSTKAMEVPSAAPAIAFGQKNKQAVWEKFERELFLDYKTPEWLWSNAENGFGVRDLGYYIGYTICAFHYEKAEDKGAAIEEMIELDYADTAAIRAYVDATKLLSRPIDSLQAAFESRRPSVVSVAPVEGMEVVPTHTTRLTITFSEPMDELYRSFEYGPLGKDASLQIKALRGYSEGSRVLNIEVEPLQPGKTYQLTVGSGFRNQAGIPMKPYLIEFSTASE